MNQPELGLETQPTIETQHHSRLGKIVALTALALSSIGIGGSSAEANIGGSLDAFELVCTDSGGNPGEAAIVNFTPVNVKSRGYGTAGPSGVKIGSSSIVNMDGSGNADPNLGIIPLNADGEVCYGSNQAGDIVKDVFGFLAPGSFRPAKADNTAVRILDSRKTGGLDAFELVCTDSGGNPGEAAIVNFTPVNVKSRGYGTAGPSGVKIGSSSIVNMDGSGNADPNLGIIPTNADNDVCYGSNQAGDIVKDVFGYLKSSAFRPAKADNTAVRILDTRENTNPGGGSYKVVSTSGNYPLLDFELRCFYNGVKRRQEVTVRGLTPDPTPNMGTIDGSKVIIDYFLQNGLDGFRFDTSGDNAQAKTALVISTYYATYSSVAISSVLNGKVSIYHHGVPDRQEPLSITKIEVDNLPCTPENI